MQIQVNTDHTIEGHEALAAQIRGVVENALSRMSDHVTRVEVHWNDENSDKHGQSDKRCIMEARLETSGRAGTIAAWRSCRLSRSKGLTMPGIRNRRRHHDTNCG